MNDLDDIRIFIIDIQWVIQSHHFLEFIMIG